MKKQIIVSLLIAGGLWAQPARAAERNVIRVKGSDTMVQLATAWALTQAQRPNFTIRVPTIDAAIIGVIDAVTVSD